MHKLHCILVEVDPNDLVDCDDLGEIGGFVREEAMDATRSYREQAFDWRSERDAGRWSDEFPGAGVVLGAAEPERFKELLRDFSETPLRAALALVGNAAYAVDAEFLRKAWENASDPFSLSQALRLVDGEYLFDSGFFSVPDGSARISPDTLEDALDGPERYALVFSDYHY